MKKKNNLLALVVVGLAITLFIGIPAVSAVESTYTKAYLRIPTAVAFEVTLVGESAVASADGGAATTDIQFNCSNANGSEFNVEAQVVGGSSQTDANPIFSIDNVGTVNLNFTISLNESVGACMDMGGDLLNTTIWDNNISTVAFSIVNDSTPAAAAIDFFLQVNFTACTNADENTVLIYVNGTES